MTPPGWDYEHAYPGRTPTWELLPLARSLYPPDAKEKGKTPSPDGKDCEAVHRVNSRLGRSPWSWATGQNKRKYSNTFSHGAAGGNVSESGIAGFQRQMNILLDDGTASGWYGPETHKTSQYCVIPDGLPHAGEPGWDAKALELYREYLDEQAAAITPASSRQKALDHQHRRLGYTEQPAESNCDERTDGIRTSQDHCADGTWLRGEPWCGTWCFYALETAGVHGIDSSLASVAQIEDNARAAAKCFRGWTTDPSKAQPGDLVVIGGYGVHVEMVRAIPTVEVTDTYGGNTSPGTTGSQSNGGGAYARTRYRQEIRGYAIVKYPDD